MNTNQSARRHMTLGGNSSSQSAMRDRELKESGALGVVALPVDSPMLNDAMRARSWALVACGALTLAFALSESFHQLGIEPERQWAQLILGAGAIAYLVSAFLFGNRLAISRSPALALLVATFLFSAIVMVAYAGAAGPARNWLWAYWHVGLVVGLVAFVASDWHWALQQRNSARLGYYSDNKLRFKKLTLGYAGQQIFTAVAGAIAAAIALLLSFGWTVKPAEQGAAHSWLAVAAAIAAGAIGCLFAIPAYRRALRYVLVLTAFGAGITAVVIGSALLRQSIGADAVGEWLPVRIGAGSTALIGSMAIVLLVFALGHASVLRWWIAAAAFATVLDCISMVVSPPGASAGPFLSYGFAVLAAIIPLAVLASDAKAALFIIDAQSATVSELALTDRTTRIPNRRALLLHLERQIACARASSVGFALTVVDIVGVKAANRAMGRHVGNELILAAAQILSGAFPPEFVVARVHGDEFVVLSPPGELSERSDCRQRIARMLNATSWVDPSQVSSLYVDTFYYDPASEQTAEAFMQASIRRATLSKRSAPPVTPAPVSVRIASTKADCAPEPLRHTALDRPSP